MKEIMMEFIAGIKETPRGYILPILMLSALIDKMISFADKELNKVNSRSSNG